MAASLQVTDKPAGNREIQDGIEPNRTGFASALSTAFWTWGLLVIAVNLAAICLVTLDAMDVVSRTGVLTALILVGIALARYRRPPESAAAPAQSWVKRQIDIYLSLLGIILLAPLVLIVALVIKCSDGGSVFYSSRRIGLDGRVFASLKFRTMVRNPEEVLHKYLVADEVARREWSETQRLSRDPRVSGVGRYLRRTGLDEIPQLFNVLIGDMSLIGPRAIKLDQFRVYGDKAAYFRTRPGLTGLWQVRDNERNPEARSALDTHYVNHWSLGMDFLILLKAFRSTLDTRRY